MSERGLTSKCSLIAGAAMVLSFAAAPVHAHAQGAPPGSYLRTCTHVATRGDTLVADCRRTDGSWGRTALRDVDRCVGDIGNMDGRLACNRGERSYGWSRDRDYGPTPRYDYDRDGGPGFGSSGGYWTHRGDWPPAGYPSDYGR
jgi:CVNH domain